MERTGINKRSVTTAAALLISLLAFSISPVLADTAPPVPPISSVDPHKAAVEQFKHDRDLFNAVMRDRQLKMRDINLAFKNAVDKANHDARATLSTVNTPVQKSSAVASRRSAIDTAINARDLAISALGPIPTPPPEPVREPRQQSNSGQGVKVRR
jgi:hypothetical protein